MVLPHGRCSKERRHAPKNGGPSKSEQGDTPRDPPHAISLQHRKRCPAGEKKNCFGCLERVSQRTTFITEWGRYRYLRAPQGFHASSDGYTKRFDDVTCDFPRVARCIDDSLLWDDDISKSFWHTLSYIQLCSENGIVFNPTKFHFAEDSLEFAGFDVTSTGYKPPNRLLENIDNFPSPTNITGVRSWFGLINQISYAFSQASVMAPFRELLEKSRPFYWDHSLEAIFQESKQEIIRSIEDGVTTFEVGRPTCLATDWSKTGIGFTLSQKHCNCLEINNPFCGTNHWKTTYAGSRFTKDSESRYAPIEGEALALLFGLTNCRMFVLGCPNLIVTVDHKPLVPILNDRDLDRIPNPRVLKIRERSLPYRFTTIAIPGEKNCGPNTLSRIPIPSQKTQVSQQSSENEIEPAMIAVLSSLENNDSFQINRIREHAVNDDQYTQLSQLLNTGGFPYNRNETPQELWDFWSMRNDLYVIKDIIFAAGRPLIPRNMRQTMLEELHIGHQGVNAMKINARQRFFWPGMHKQIQHTRENCQRCNETAPSQPKEPLTKGPNPEFPFQLVATDLFHMAGHTYIIYADRFSGWTEVATTKNPNTDTITNILRRYFSTFGVPEELSSDGGPPFNGNDFQTFLKRWGIANHNSSAYFAQSNGRAESAVKSMKRILTTNISPSGSLDTDAVAKALLLHRNTPPADMGVLPSELLFGRNITDHMPKPITFRREWSELADLREKAYAQRYDYATKNENSKELNPIKIGDTVSLQNQKGNHPTKWNATGTIVDCFPHRKYQVLVDGSRRCTIRNRRFLRKTTTRIITDEDSSRPATVQQISDGESKNDNELSPDTFPAHKVTASPTTDQSTHQPIDAIDQHQQRTTDCVQEATALPTPQIVEPPRRSTRSKRLPTHLKDFVLT